MERGEGGEAMVRDAGTELRAGAGVADARALGGVPPLTRALFVLGGTTPPADLLVEDWAPDTPLAGCGAEFAAAAEFVFTKRCSPAA
jgi:hypothetical protein